MLLKILQYPNELLLKPTKDVVVFDNILSEQIENMFETMYAKNGIGLAANQVGISLNMFVMDTNKHPFVFINPKIINKSSIMNDYLEGCLSFPGMKINIARSDSIHLEWQDLQGIIHQQEFHDLSAICIQHELEHLQGHTFIKNLNNTKKQLFLQKYSKNNKK